MCIEDIKIGRSLDSQIKNVTCVDAAQTTIAPPDNKRTFLMVSGTGQNSVFLTTRGLTSSVSIGITLTASNPVVKLTVQEIGSLIFQEWVAAPTVAPQTLTVLTSSLAANNASELRG